jgi:hypothetical protein
MWLKLYSFTAIHVKFHKISNLRQINNKAAHIKLKQQY